MISPRGFVWAIIFSNALVAGVGAVVMEAGRSEISPPPKPVQKEVVEAPISCVDSLRSYIHVEKAWMEAATDQEANDLYGSRVYSLMRLLDMHCAPMYEGLTAQEEIEAYERAVSIFRNLEKMKESELENKHEMAGAPPGVPVMLFYG